MPRFFFNIRDTAEYYPDEEGADLVDLDAAHAEAMRGARGILAERLLAGDPLDGQRLEVTDEKGRVVLTLPFAEAMKLP